MLKKQSFPMVMGLVISIFVALLMPELVYFLSAGGTLAGFTAEKFIQDFILNLALGFMIGSLIPAAPIGGMIAKKIGIKNENSLIFHLVRTFVVAFIMVLILSILMLFLELGFIPGFFGIWSKVAPIIFAVVYVYLLIMLPVSVKITSAICCKD